MNKKKFAETVLLAQEIREKSWDPVSEHYREEQNSSALIACIKKDLEPEWADIIYFLNYLAWNDVQDWANLNK